MPIVSVLMGSFNGSEKMDKAIKSIVGQTFGDWEFIICDDGSTDKTFSKLLEWQKKDKRIIPLKNEKNLGLAKTLNICLSISKGKYIARMDDDDISHPERFEKEVAFLDSHPEFAIVSTRRNFYDDHGIWGEDYQFGEVSNYDVFCGRFFAHPTVMMRKDALLSVEGYSTYKGIGREEDTDLWFKMYANGYKGFILNDVLFDYYESKDSMARRKYRYRIAEYKLKKRYRKKLGIKGIKKLNMFKPLIIGLIPNCIIKLHHKRKCLKKNKYEKN